MHKPNTSDEVTNTSVNEVILASNPAGAINAIASDEILHSDGDSSGGGDTDDDILLGGDGNARINGQASDDQPDSGSGFDPAHLTGSFRDDGTLICPDIHRFHIPNFENERLFLTTIKSMLLRGACKIAHLIWGTEDAAHLKGDVTKFYRFTADLQTGADKYTEGFYETGQESPTEANTKQSQLIFSALNLPPGSRVLDIGCGDGHDIRIGRDDYGLDMVGLNLTPEQVEKCRKEGFSIVQCNYFEALDHLQPSSFDAIIMNGSTEHFCRVEDVNSGRKEEVYNNMFGIAGTLLKPGGKIFITCIHARYPIDVNKLERDPFSFRVGSYDFYMALLEKWFSGWYPYLGEYDRHARNNGLDVVFNIDATMHYLLWSLDRRDRLRNQMKSDPTFKKRYLATLRQWFRKNPYYLWIFLTATWCQCWTWQFTPNSCGLPPTSHRWILFKKK